MDGRKEGALSSGASVRGVVRKGKFVPDDPGRFATAMRSREGKRTRLLIGPEPRGRSNPQLDYYWVAIVRPAAIWLGLSRDQYDSAGEDEMHEILLREVLVPMLPERFLLATPKGDRVQGRGSTKRLSLEEMTAYMTRCKDWLAGHDFYVEDIDHVWIRKEQ